MTPLTPESSAYEELNKVFTPVVFKTLTASPTRVKESHHQTSETDNCEPGENDDKEKHTTTHQVSETQDEQLSQNQVTANQAPDDQVSQSTHLEHQIMENDQEHCTVSPSKAVNAIKDKDTDEIIHNVEKHPEDSISDQKPSPQSSNRTEDPFCCAHLWD